MTLTSDDEKYLLNISRKSIESITRDNIILEVPNDCPEHLKEKLGVFCTINKNNNLRGCIGYPEPVKPLINALIDVSISAAQNDYRFETLKEEELKDIKIEITILTKPELIKVEKNEEYLEKINIGEDGLIIKTMFNTGLLLPQVATEYNMDVKTFLEHTCLKAGLKPNDWLNKKDIEIYKFQGKEFSE